MIEVAALQILSKVLLTKDISIIQNNLLTEDYFIEYVDEYNYIMNHYKEYGNVPDKATFLAQFPDVELVEVEESDKYLVDTIREEWKFNKAVPILKTAAKLLKTDSNEAVDYLMQQMANLDVHYSLSGIDIVAQAKQRYDNYIERRDHKDNWTFSTGFEELDEVIHGIERQEELIVLFARINNGKSFVSQKICTHIWQVHKENVGYISPEMSANSVGYRFDTLYKGFSNKSLMWGTEGLDDKEYYKYIDELKEHTNKFLVATPIDFDRVITVTKVKEWIKQNDLKFVVIDGITYLTDERAKRNDNTTTRLTHISEDLMSLSIEMHVPILVVVQANRGGVVNDEEHKDDMPDLEHIKDSDGMAANASKVLSLRHTKDGILKIAVAKNRFGMVGATLSYNWQPDIGEFTFIPNNEDDYEHEEEEEVERPRRRKKAQTKEDMF